MFRKMRRIRQQITQEECMEIMQRGSHGVLGTIGDDGYPYTVPLSYVYTPGEEGGCGKLHFHCAVSGHKIDAIRGCDKVSFCVVDRDDVMPKERTTKYASVIAFGHARILETEEELRASANLVGAKYSSGYEDLYKAETEETILHHTLCCVEITIDPMTGKIGRQVLIERGAEQEN